MSETVRIALKSDGSVTRNGKQMDGIYKPFKIAGKRTGAYLWHARGSTEIFESEKALREYLATERAFPMLRAQESALGAMESIRDEMRALAKAKTDRARDEAMQAIREGSLCSEIRGGWHVPGNDSDAEEYTILLGTGGPAVRIYGELGQYNEPSNARLQCQDWFTPWVDVDVSSEDSETLLAYAQCYNFEE